MPNRRDFIKSVVGASAGVVFTGCDVCDAMAAGRPGAGWKRRKAQAGHGGEAAGENRGRSLPRERARSHRTC